MLDAQLRLMRSMGMEQVELEERLVYRGSEVKPARIGNMLFRSAQFRKVRLTYFDGGDAVQVFNTLWYPSYEYDAPMLGVDLISLGLSRVLNVIDFQPLHPTPEYSAKHIDHLASIRSKYPELHGTLSGKIYDDTSFFSKQMLFGRFTDESKVAPVVQPAFEDYLSAYIETVGRCVPDTRQESMAEVKLRQKAYDIYSAQKDPAVGIFDAYFGKDWSYDYVHNFLFSLNEPISGNILTDISPVQKFQINSAGQVGIAAKH